MEKVLSMNSEQLDGEWVELILSALQAGISPQEIRDFFHKNANFKN